MLGVWRLGGWLTALVCTRIWPNGKPTSWWRAGCILVYEAVPLLELDTRMFGLKGAAPTCCRARQHAIRGPKRRASVAGMERTQ